MTPEVSSPTRKYVAKLHALTSELESGRDAEFVFGKWAVGLSDCSRLCVPHGLMSCFCPWVTLARISARVEPGSFRSTMGRTSLFYFGLFVMVLSSLLCVVAFGPADMFTVTISLVLIPFLWIAVVVSELRTRVRSRFEIPGSAVGERGMALCCGPCVTAQMAVQVKIKDAGPCDFSQPDALPAYFQ